MTFWGWYCILMRYYSLSYSEINEMTIWQFVEAIKNVGWLEKQANQQGASADVIFGKVPGQTPSSRDIKAMAKQIGPEAERAARLQWQNRKK